MKDAVPDWTEKLPKLTDANAAVAIYKIAIANTYSDAADIARFYADRQELTALTAAQVLRQFADMLDQCAAAIPRLSA